VGLAGTLLSKGATTAATGGAAAGIGSVLGSGVNIVAGRVSDSGTSFVALINALATDANTNIVGTPVLVTMDNEEAQIKVGQEIPFVTGQFTNTGATSGSTAVNPFQTIQRQQVGLTLKITPQINEGDAILLKIEQELSSLAESSRAVDLTTNKRTINTSVIVEDGGTLVLGGLIQDDLNEKQQRVPLLGSLPLIGHLFRVDSTNKKKTNLMVFIKPTILRDDSQASFETNAKYNYLRNLQLAKNPNSVQLMPSEVRPVLPAAPTQAAPPAIDLRPLKGERDGDGTAKKPN
jgi:general secretion pathway protein D